MRVLLATDMSGHSETALEFLSSLPVHRSIELLLISVSAASPIHQLVGAQDSTGVPEWLRRQWESVQVSLVETARRHQSEFKSVDTLLATGSPGREVVRRCQARKTDLAVLGSVGHSTIARILLGSVSDYVATHANCSTLVVRPCAGTQRSEQGTANRPSSVLVAIGNADNDIESAKWIENLGLPLSTEIHLVHVLEDVPFFEVDLLRKASAYWKEVRSVAAKHIETLNENLRTLGYVPHCEMVSAPHIGSALLDYANQKHCDLIITGDQRETVSERVFLGSTSRYVLRHAIGSVLISR